MVWCLNMPKHIQIYATNELLIFNVIFNWTLYVCSMKTWALYVFLVGPNKVGGKARNIGVESGEHTTNLNYIPDVLFLLITQNSSSNN